MEKDELLKEISIRRLTHCIDWMVTIDYFTKFIEPLDDRLHRRGKRSNQLSFSQNKIEIARFYIQIRHWQASMLSVDNDTYNAYLHGLTPRMKIDVIKGNIVHLDSLLLWNGGHRHWLGLIYFDDHIRDVNHYFWFGVIKFRLSIDSSSFLMEHCEINKFQQIYLIVPNGLFNFESKKSSKEITTQLIKYQYLEQFQRLQFGLTLYQKLFRKTLLSRMKTNIPKKVDGVNEVINISKNLRKEHLDIEKKLKGTGGKFIRFSDQFIVAFIEYHLIFHVPYSSKQLKTADLFAKNFSLAPTIYGYNLESILRKNETLLFSDILLIDKIEKFFILTANEFLFIFKGLELKSIYRLSENNIFWLSIRCTSIQHFIIARILDYDNSTESFHLYNYHNNEFLKKITENEVNKFGRSPQMFMVDFSTFLILTENGTLFHLNTHFNIFYRCIWAGDVIDPIIFKLEIQDIRNIIIVGKVSGSMWKLFKVKYINKNRCRIIEVPSSLYQSSTMTSLDIFLDGENALQIISGEDDNWNFTKTNFITHNPLHIYDSSSVQWINSRTIDNNIDDISLDINDEFRIEVESEVEVNIIFDWLSAQISHSQFVQLKTFSSINYSDRSISYKRLIIVQSIIPKKCQEFFSTLNVNKLIKEKIETFENDENGECLNILIRKHLISVPVNLNIVQFSRMEIAPIIQKRIHITCDSKRRLIVRRLLIVNEITEETLFIGNKTSQNGDKIVNFINHYCDKESLPDYISVPKYAFKNTRNDNKKVFYDKQMFGCPVSISASYKIRFLLGLIEKSTDGIERLVDSEITSSFFIQEINGRYDFFPNETTLTSGCRAAPTNHTEYFDSTLAYEQLYCHSEINRPKNNEKPRIRPFIIYNSTHNFVSFPKPYIPGVYMFNIKLVDPLYSLCDYETFFAVDVHQGVFHAESLSTVRNTAKFMIVLIASITFGLLPLTYVLYRTFFIEKHKFRLNKETERYLQGYHMQYED
ncbi:hypothetical protein SNEBB_008071 [Seison nebaliae]|nr:hypothetical protein SNEBB_008071 [Seison nebaliae]